MGNHAKSPADITARKESCPCYLFFTAFLSAVRVFLNPMQSPSYSTFTANLADPYLSRPPCLLALLPRTLPLRPPWRKSNRRKGSDAATSCSPTTGCQSWPQVLE